MDKNVLEVPARSRRDKTSRKHSVTQRTTQRKNRRGKRWSGSQLRYDDPRSKARRQGERRFGTGVRREVSGSERVY
jgi:hypothetical protein